MEESAGDASNRSTVGAQANGFEFSVIDESSKMAIPSAKSAVKCLYSSLNTDMFLGATTRAISKVALVILLRQIRLVSKTWRDIGESVFRRLTNQGWTIPELQQCQVHSVL